MASSCGPFDAELAGALSRRVDAIIGGVEDSVFESVVLVRLSPGFCSGTLILREGTTGFVLTAAHCLSGPALSVERWGSTSVQASYPVLSQRSNPRYASLVGAFDLGVVSISNVGDGLAAMPVATQPTSAVATGVSTTLAGFGRTMGGTGADPNPVRRRRVTLPISAFDEYTARFELTTQGPCFGDSGGPGLISIQGVETVAMVASTLYAGGASCTGTFAEARTSSDPQWIDSAIRELGGSGLPGFTVDAGTADAGPVADAGASIDAGVLFDGGATTDAGASADSGFFADAGATSDAGADFGALADGGHTNMTASSGLEPVRGGCVSVSTPEGLMWILAVVVIASPRKRRACRLYAKGGRGCQRARRA